MAKSKSNVSESLKQTLISQPEIEKVHFNDKRTHYFNVFRHGSELYGRVIVQKVMDEKKRVPVEVKVPVQSTRIVESISREEIMGSETVPDSKSGLISLDGK